MNPKIRLGNLLGVLLVGALTARIANAAEPPVEPSSLLDPNDALSRFRLGVRAGYAAAWTAGATDWGLGLSGTLSYETQSAHVFRLDATRYIGGETRAPGRYSVDTSALAIEFGLGHRFQAAWFAVTPGVRWGTTAINESTRVSTTLITSSPFLFIFGPSVALGIAGRRFELKLELEAHMVPARVASASLGSFLVFCVKL